jgi:hypothetical protein
LRSAFHLTAQLPNLIAGPVCAAALDLFAHLTGPCYLAPDEVIERLEDQISHRPAPSPVSASTMTSSATNRSLLRPTLWQAVASHDLQLWPDCLI